MRLDTSFRPPVSVARAVVVTAILFSASVTAGAAEAGGEPAVLAGNTLSAVAWVARSAANSGGGDLIRLMLQAYLRQDGSALVRIWDPTRNAYTQPAERSWTLAGSKLCLDLPVPGPGRICAEVHSWGPRIAGIGTTPYVMLDGDLKPGNVLISKH